MTEVIDSMRTYFVRPGADPVDAVTFADRVLASQKRAVNDQLGRIGFAAEKQVALLDVALGEPTQPVTARPLVAYVNHGAWLVKCECGGCEYVDLTSLVVMCASCWNEAHAHKFRTVTIPLERTRIEAALLMRSRENRNWKTGETAADLERENTERGL